MSWVSYSLNQGDLDSKYVAKTKNKLKLSYPCSSNTTCFPYVVRLKRGEYVFECFGASGGNGKVSEGGKGGHSKGSITLEKTTTFYIFIGGRGSSGTGEAYAEIPGGYNGGGKGVVGKSKLAAGSGGGATDIRRESLLVEARIMVAGGGGGAGTLYNSPYIGAGGSGGGTSGENGSTGTSNINYIGKGGTSTKAGSNANGSADDSSGGGGGGGYFNGGGGYCSGGGGGSGFVSNDFSSELFDKTTTVSGGSGHGSVTIMRYFYSERFMVRCTTGRHNFFGALTSLIVISFAK